MRRMEGYWIRIVLCAAVLLAATLLAGCVHGKVKPLEQPLELTAFSYSHAGMHSGEYYSMELEKVENGTHVIMSLNAGAHTVDVIVQEDLLADLSAAATEYRMDLWDGFDKADRRVLDGETFWLKMQLNDGRTISAKGSNAYPEGYHEALPYIKKVINELTVEYTEYYPRKIESDEITFFSYAEREKPYATSEFSVSCQRNEDGTAELTASVRAREDLSKEDLEVITTLESFPFDEIQALLRGHSVIKWNGRNWQEPGYETVSLFVRYASGEVLEIYGMQGAEAFANCRKELKALLMDIILSEAE